jgi:outer membrane receptor for ferric coprogen and ferric-rhodotorulic acid
LLRHQTVEQGNIIVKGAKTKGFEVEALGQLTDAWTLTFGYAYNDTEDAKGKKINMKRIQQRFQDH